MTLNPKKRILDLVAQGILTSDEALDLLENLDSDIDSELEKLEAEVIEEAKEESEEPVEEVLGEEDDLSADDFTARFNQFASDLVKATNTTLQKIRKIQQTSNFERHVEEQFDEIDSIFIDLQKGSVDIVVDEASHGVIVEQDYIIQASDEKVADDLLLKSVSTSYVDNIFRLSSEKKAVNAQITITLPHKEYSIVDVSISNGNASLSDINLDDLTVSLSNGNLNLHSIVAQSITTNLKDGVLDIEGTSQQLNLSNLFGPSAIQGNFEKTKLESRTGSIIFKNASETAQQLYIKTRTGDIKIALNDELGLTGQARLKKGELKSLMDLNVIKPKEDLMTFSKEGDNQLLLDIESRYGEVYMKGLES